MEYAVYEVSADGLLKRPVFSEGYGYTSQLGNFITMEDAMNAIDAKDSPYREFVILPVYRSARKEP